VKLGGYPSFTDTNARGGNGSYGGALFYLLPFIEQQNMYNLCRNAGGSGYDPERGANGLLTQTVKTYACPSDPTYGNGLAYGWAAVGSYVFSSMIFKSDWLGYSTFPASISDGTSNTIFFTETYSLGTSTNGSLQPNLWWWDYNGFETPPDSNYYTDCGGLNFWGQAFVPLVAPSPQYCLSNTVKGPDKTTNLIVFCTGKAQKTCNLVQQFGVLSEPVTESTWGGFSAFAGAGRLRRTRPEPTWAWGTAASVSWRRGSVGPPGSPPARRMAVRFLVRIGDRERWY
jgi:hypothetical protein